MINSHGHDQPLYAILDPLTAPEDVMTDDQSKDHAAPRDPFDPYDPFERVTLPPGVDYYSEHQLARKNRVADMHVSNFIEGVEPDPCIIVLEAQLLKANAPSDVYQREIDELANRRTAHRKVLRERMNRAGLPSYIQKDMLAAYRDQPLVEWVPAKLLELERIAS